MVNDNGDMGLVPAVMVLLLIAAGVMGVLMLTNEFNIHYDNVISDPINNTGIMAGNNYSAYQAVNVTSETIISNLPTALLIAFLFAVIVLILLVWAILHK